MTRGLRTIFLRFALGLGLIGAVMPTLAFAQPDPTDRLDRALSTTDSRIDAAAAQLRGTPQPEAQLALDRARALQVQAREVVQRGGPPRRAGNLTMRARFQAEHAIAILRGLPDADRVQGQLERTHTMLESARARVAGCDDRSVFDLLHEADDVQRRAEAAAGEGRPLAALQLTFAARERGQEALRRCRVQDDPADHAGRALQSTDSLIARARATPDGAGAPRGMLERAGALQGQARDAYRAGRFPLALRLTTDAGALARRAARLSDTR